MSTRLCVLIFLLLQCFTLPAQFRRRVSTEAVDPPRAPLPDPATTLSLFADAATRLRDSPPLFSCSALTPPAPGSRQNLILDFNFVGPQATVNDWDRFQSDSSYRSLVETQEAHQHLDLSAVIRTVLSLNAGQFTVDRWVSFRTGNHRNRYAVVVYSDAARQATFYVHHDTGAISRIQLRGFPTTGLATPQHCQAE